MVINASFKKIWPLESMLIRKMAQLNWWLIASRGVDVTPGVVTTSGCRLR